MSMLVKELRKHLLIYWLLAKSSLIAQMEFRSNFLVLIGMEFIWILMRLSYLLVIYQNGIVMVGIPPDGMLLYLGSYFVVTGMFNGLFLGNIFSIPDYVRDGTLDLLMTKPISLQFYVTLRRVNFINPLPMLLGGTVAIVLGWKNLGIPISMTNISLFLVYLGVGAAMSYAIYLAPFLLSFWVVRVDGAYTFFDTTWELNNIPMNAYNRWVKWIGVFLFPIFMISNFPSSYLLGKLNLGYEVWGIAAPVLCLLFVRMLWRTAIPNYTGASS